MSNKLDDKVDKIKNSLRLYLIITSIFTVSIIGLSKIVTVNSYIEDIVAILFMLLSFFALYFILKYYKLSSQINTSKLLKSKLTDERECFIDYKAQSKAFIACTWVIALYVVVASFQKVMLQSSYLMDISGIYIAFFLSVFGNLVYAISAHNLDKE